MFPDIQAQDGDALVIDNGLQIDTATCEHMHNISRGRIAYATTQP
jgi:hypothetical protein